MKKNVTLNAEDGLIQAARQKAAREGTSLNHLFRRWVSAYVQPGPSEGDYAQLMARLSHAAPGKTFSRDELNER